MNEPSQSRHAAIRTDLEFYDTQLNANLSPDCAHCHETGEMPG
ncbi:MAG: hypothetical protein ACJ0SL_03455 [Candidatus Rariloculaceae bacterium]